MAKPFKTDEIMESLDDEIKTIQQATARSIAGSVVLSTPIGRPDLWLRPPAANYRPGTARGNWRATISNPPPDRELPTRDPVGATTIGFMEATIRFWNGRDTLYIGNAADHIVPLDRGIASRQVGANFVEKAVAQGIAALDNQRVELP